MAAHWNQTDSSKVAYRRICREARRSHRLLFPVAPRPILLRMPRALAVAASLAFLSLPAATLAGSDPDPHCLPLEAWEDPDQDLLKSEEEELLNCNPAVADEDRNGVADGVDLARALSQAIDALPTEPSSTNIHVIPHLTFGLESCAVCGEMVNMGVLEIIHPLEKQSVSVPCVAKHYLERGSFSYNGSIHSGRLNVMFLRTLLQSTGPVHLLPEPAGTDRDRDGLRDTEEPSLGTDPQRADSDGDLLLDAVDLARSLRTQLDALPHVSEATAPTDRPYIIDHPMDGIETCPACGDRVVMDIWDVINPVAHTQIRISSMALHYLDHGGFRWRGGQLDEGQGRVDPRQLQAVLTGTGDGHQRSVRGDTDQDLLRDTEEAELGRDPGNPDENANQIPDGVDLATGWAKRIAALPTSPQEEQVYRLDFSLNGMQRCDVCGEWVNMGWLTLCNPRAELYCRIPYVGLHFLEHGSFDLAGNRQGEDRIDVGLLQATLESTGPSHRQPLPKETDGDGLSDAEEKELGTDPTKPDSDGDGVPDGFEIARGCWRALLALPRTPDPQGYVIEYPLRGLVTCPVCGLNVNMGHVELVAPGATPGREISYLLLHYLQHGSFAISPEERVDPLDLMAQLRPVARAQMDASRPQLRWMGRAGQRYEVLAADDASGPWVSAATYAGLDAELVFEETAATGAGRRFYRLRTW